MPLPIVETRLFFWIFHRRVSQAFDLYLATGNSSLASKTATTIYSIKQDWAEYISESPEGDLFKLELFDEVVARVVRQNAMVSPPVTYQQNMLVQLVLHILSSPLNPTGSLRVQALINETGTKLVSLRTELLDFIQDDSEPADMPASIASFINLGLCMSAIFCDATKRPAYPLDSHDLESLGQVGVELIAGIAQADNDFDIHEDLIRLNIFKVCITWFGENQEFLSKALWEEHDLYLCQDRLFSFLDSDWLEHIAEDEYPILVKKAENAVLVVLRNLAQRFGRQSLSRILRAYGEDWLDWALGI